MWAVTCIDSVQALVRLGKAFDFLLIFCGGGGGRCVYCIRKILLLVCCTFNQ